MPHQDNFLVVSLVSRSLEAQLEEKQESMMQAGFDCSSRDYDETEHSSIGVFASVFLIVRTGE
jgi:hypothetical protein